MTFRAVQPNFSRGELAPALYGRFDVEAWQSACRQARNVFVLKYGGLSKRPGTRLVGEVLDASAPNRLIPFEFSLDQTYALEMGQGYMAPCALGGRILEEHLAITDISIASNAQITAAYHGYEVGQRVWLTGVNGSLGDAINNFAWPITGVPDADNFTIAFNSQGFTFEGADGGITRVGAPTPTPPPPVVPSPVPEPDEPYVGGGGGGGWRPDGQFPNLNEL